MSWIMDAIKDNLIEIVIYGFMFLAGFGIGGAITDMIRSVSDEKKVHKSRTNKTNNHNKDQQHRRTAGQDR